MVLAEPQDACETLQNSDAASGSMILFLEGGCSNDVKADNVVAAGASGGEQCSVAAGGRVRSKHHAIHSMKQIVCVVLLFIDLLAAP